MEFPMAHATASTRATEASSGLVNRALSDQNIVPLAHDVPTAARLIGIGPSKTWALIAEGKIRATRIGRRTLISAREIERVLETGC
jgi:excisionase family DNA binding protein